MKGVKEILYENSWEQGVGNFAKLYKSPILDINLATIT